MCAARAAQGSLLTLEAGAVSVSPTAEGQTPAALPFLGRWPAAGITLGLINARSTASCPRSALPRCRRPGLRRFSPSVFAPQRLSLPRAEGRGIRVVDKTAFVFTAHSMCYEKRASLLPVRSCTTSVLTASGGRLFLLRKISGSRLTVQLWCRLTASRHHALRALPRVSRGYAGRIRFP